MNTNNGWVGVTNWLELSLDSLFNLNPLNMNRFDSLLTIDEIQELGYINNFPHLTCLMCHIPESEHQDLSSRKQTLQADKSSGIASYALLPAACYKLYLAYRDSELDNSKLLGCIASCFRNEDKALDTYRAINFTMKEFVCLGSANAAEQHIENSVKLFSNLLEELNISYSIDTALDPFFDGDSSVALMSRLLPTKQEITYKGNAIASVNIHRSYFGEKFNISIDNTAAHSSCAAVGIERFIAMLQEEFETPDTAMYALETATKRLASQTLKQPELSDAH